MKHINILQTKLVILLPPSSESSFSVLDGRPLSLSYNSEVLRSCSSGNRTSALIT
jgi:hypothetical protein